MSPLAGRVAVVCGATRGAGRGIAVGLGEAGATVVCVGRSSRTGGPGPEYADRQETIEETAELVDAAGGVGVPAICDLLDVDAVTALAARVRDEHGHVDVLVNDTWGGERLKEWDRPVWEHDLANGLRLLHLAVDTHLIAAHHILPLVVDRPGGLLVEVTDGTASYNDANYRINAFYDLAKVAVNRLAFSLGHELAKVGGAAVAVSPGWMRSELMLQNYEVTEDRWRDALAIARPEFSLSETPRFVGRGVAALAADPDRARWNQRSVTSGELAGEYGVVDLDGTAPDIWRWMADDEAGTAGPLDSYRR